MFGIFALVIAVIIWLVFNQSINQSIRELWGRYMFAKSLNGPDLFWVVNNLNPNNSLSWLAELSKKYGPVYRLWFALDLMVVVTDSEYLNVILTSNILIEKGVEYALFEHWLGKGLLTNGGASWHQQRKLLTPAFHFKILGSFKSPIEDCCNILVDKLSSFADGKSDINIYAYISLFSLDVICETAMGVKSNGQLDKDSEFVEATNTMCRVSFARVFSMLTRFSVLFDLSSNGRKSRHALRVLNDKTRSVIAEKRLEFEKDLIRSKTMNNNNDDDGVGQKKKFSFLDSLLRAQREGAQLTDKMIEDEVNTFMFAGHDTTSSGISFAIYALSKNPECQSRAREDVLQAEGHIEKMIYLDAFIKETLRLYPSVPLYTRRVVEPFTFGTYVVPKSVSIAVLAATLHRDPTIYPDPNTFNPERFLNGGSAHPFSFLAFSAGPRNCIGQRFAMLEMKCALSKILQTFNVLPVDGFEPILVARMILFSTNGIKVRLSKI